MSMNIDYQKGIYNSVTGSSYVYPARSATNSIAVIDYTALSGKTITVNGTVLTEGVEWSASTSNDATATAISSAIDVVSGTTDIDAAYDASIDSGVVYLKVITAGAAGNSKTLATNATGVQLVIGGATFSGGYDAIPASDQGTNSIKLGEQNVIDSNSANSLIIATENNAIIDSDGCYIFGGDGNEIVDNSGDPNSVIVAGDGNKIQGGNTFASIIGGDLNLIDYLIDYGTIVGSYNCKISDGIYFGSSYSSEDCIISGSGQYQSIIASTTSFINTTGSNNSVINCNTCSVSGQCGEATILGSYNSSINIYDDYSMILGGSNQDISTGSGYNTIVGNGYNSIINNSYGSIIVGGESCTADGSYTFVRGYRTVAQGDNVHAFGNSRTNTRNQIIEMVGYANSTSATPANVNISVPFSRLLYTGSTATNAVYAITIMMASIQTAGTAGTVGDSCVKKYDLVVKNLGGTCTQVGSTTTTTIAYDSAASTWVLTPTVDDTNDELDMTFTGEADKTIDTTVHITVVEVAK